MLFFIKSTPSCSFKYFESSDIIAVKKKSLLNIYYLSCWKGKMVAEHLDLQTQQNYNNNIRYNNDVIITILQHEDPAQSEQFI